MAERVLGKDEVAGSIPALGSLQFTSSNIPAKIKLMPYVSQTVNCPVKDEARLWRQLSTVNCQRWRRGFTLIEIALSLFLILALIAILLTTSGTYVHSRRSNLQTIASKIASCEIEQLRNTAFASISTGNDIDIIAPCNQDISKLPTPNSAKRTIANYGTPTPDPKIKQVNIKVTWTENNASREIKMDTLISENGL